MKSLLFLLAFFLTGCLRVNVNPEADIACVQNAVERRSGYTALPTDLEELNVDTAVLFALYNSPQLKAVYQNLGIAKADLAQACLLTNPIVGFSYEYAQMPKVTNLITASLLHSALETALIPLKKRMKANELDAVKAFVTAQVLEVIADVKNAFYTYQANENILRMKEDLVLAKEAALDAATSLYHAGNLRELDLTEKQAEYQKERIALAEAKVTLYKSQEKLNVLLGLCGGWEADTTLPAIDECEFSLEEVETLAISNSLDLHMLKKQMRATAASFGIDITRTAIPEFDIGVSSEREDSVWYVGPALAFALPIFDWGQARQAAAKAVLCQQWHAYTAFAIKVRAEARLMGYELLTAQRISHNYEKTIVPTSEKLTTLTLHQHNAMQIGVFALLETKQREIEQKIEAIMAMKEYWIAKTELDLLLQGHMR